jgi:integrase/recombinase XerD
VREIPLPTFLLDALRKRPDGLLFPSVKGKENKVMLRTLKDVVKRAGLPGTWTLHKFRKTYATLQSASGIDVRTIQARLGHSSISTTLIYLQGEEPRSAVSKGQVNKAFSAFA